MTRPLNKIAAEIRTLWKDRGPRFMFPARPYLDAMLELTDLNQCYGVDPAEGIVRYLLSNVDSWRGEDARRIKSELHQLLEENDASHTSEKR